jgi:hypothetical protein
MFTDSSRYYKQKIVDAIADDGRIVKALTLRRLPPVTGKDTEVKGTDRLDIITQRQYGNPTMFWYVADANTELQANNLLKMTTSVKVIKVPEN